MGEGGYDLSVDFCGVPLRYPWMNASGIWSNVPVLERRQEYMGAAVLKSAGPEEKPGNETPVIHKPSDGVVINAVGLPNAGYEDVIRELDDSDIEIPVIASIFAYNVDDMARIASAMEECRKVRFMEINISCPNIKPGEKTGIAIGRVPGTVAGYVAAARESTDKRLIVKHTPAPYIFDMTLFTDIVYASDDAGADVHSAINAVPGGMALDLYNGKPVLSTGRGGVSGRGIKPIGIGCVRMIHELLPGKPIIGMGGIESVEDVAEYMRAGATAVAMGTALENDMLFREFAREMGPLMERLGAARVSELVGERLEA